MTGPQEACSFIGVTEMLNCGNKLMMFSCTGPVREREGVTSNNSVPRAERIFREGFAQRQN